MTRAGRLAGRLDATGDGLARASGARPHAPGPGPSGAPPPELVAAVSAVAGALRSGADPATAWERGLGVSTVGGVPSPADLVHRFPGDLASAAAVLAAARLAVEVGAAPAQVLDRVAATLTREAEAAGQRRAALAGPLATARVLAWLPALGLVLGATLGADPVAVLLGGGPGTALLVLGSVLTGIGRRWTARHVRVATAAGRDR